MSFFMLILLGIPVLSLIWFVWALRSTAMRNADRRTRVAFTIATAGLLMGFLWLFLYRADHVSWEPPPWVQAAVLLWGLMFLPLLAFPSLLGGALWQTITRIRRLLASRRAAKNGESPATAARPDRRRFLATTAVALPVIATYGTTAISIPQIRHFRVRRLDVPLPGLPRDLDGLTIAHISDVHVGKFTNGRILTELAEATNQLKADCIALTGDLIDHALDDLPEALDMVRRLDPRSGLFLIEGNHDLFEGREQAGIDDVYLMRLEQLYPFPARTLIAELARFPNAEIVWCQEEPRNMGGWHHVESNIEWVLEHIDGKSKRPRYIGRPASAATATGLLSKHLSEQNTLVAEALGE